MAFSFLYLSFSGVTDLDYDWAFCRGSVPGKFFLAGLQLTAKDARECAESFHALRNLLQFRLEQIAHLAARAHSAAR